jgi:ATP-dependent DNA helicase HFM1/MER3
MKSIRMAIDEVHLLNDHRGSTLEVCLTRTKIRAESRFVLVSATAPNVVDIANWIGARDGPSPSYCQAGSLFGWYYPAQR